MIQLRRITSGGRFVPEIDGLRFVAIASVILYHLHSHVLVAGAVAEPQGSFRAFIEHGARGVNLFYVISGFILGLPFAARYLKGRPSVPLKGYFLRRLTRLEPPYILNLLICFAFLVIRQGASVRALLPHLAASLLYLHNISFGSASAINTVAWTLEVEVQFYCLVPLLATIFSVRSKMARRTALVCIILFAGIAQMLFWPDTPALGVTLWRPTPRVSLTILYAIQFFLTGFLLADIYLVDWNEHPTPHWGWDLVSLFCWPLIFTLGNSEVWAWLPLLMLAVYVATFRGVLFNSIFTHKAITSIGGMCYTLYLFHYKIITLVFRLTGPVHIGRNFFAYLALQAGLILPVLLLASGIYFVLVERPCMVKDWPRRLLSRLRAASASADEVPSQKVEGPAERNPANPT
jgi:peptidoglycan/LPS O-acetylase OafA/YrhL